MTQPQTVGQSLWTWLFNPFHYVAGGAALITGMAAVAVASLNGSLIHGHFDGVLDFHLGTPMPAWFYLFEGAVDWLTMGALLYGAGWALSDSRFRAIDVFGTQALARVQTLLVVPVAMLPGFQRQLARLMAGNPEVYSLDIAAFAFAAIVTIGALVWMVVLMYRGFSVSCNVRGAKAIVTFAAALLLGEIVSKIVLIQAMYAVMRSGA
ncbi:MAG: hypothetical protein QG656_2776 [Candidatus Hydrogenedentes bacterium]|nr:hypothetical protein [Candidatus Hydrogenedentota bacterium]